jgi:hypothetical protein
MFPRKRASPNGTLAKKWIWNTPSGCLQMCRAPVKEDFEAKAWRIEMSFMQATGFFVGLLAVIAATVISLKHDTGFRVFGSNALSVFLYGAAAYKAAR